MNSHSERLRPLALAAVVLFASSGADAQNVVLTRVGSGARAAGMANAFVAVCDDGTAASWNPGGLAQLRKPELSLVASTLGTEFRFDGFRSLDDRFLYNNERFDFSTTSLEFAAVALPFDAFSKPVTMQVGWRRLYQLSLQGHAQFARLPSGPGLGLQPAQLRHDQSVNGNVDLLSLAGSVRLTGRLLLGGSLDFVRGGWEVNAGVVETPGRSAPSDLVSTRETHRQTGESATVGMLLTYPAVNVGLVYHFPFWMDYDIDLQVDSNLQPPSRLHSEPGTRMRFPTSIAAGVAWRPNSAWTLAADLTHDEWSRTTVDRRPGQTAPSNFFDGLPEDLTSARDTLTLAVGAERLFRGTGFVIPWRFGFAYEPQGAMDPVTRDPIDMLMVSTGSGFNNNHVKLDVAVQYRWTSYRVVEQLGAASVLAGIGDSTGVAHQHEWRIKVSAIYRIVDTDKLRGLLKRVFVGS